MEVLDLQNKTVCYKIIDNIMFKADGETGITFTFIFKITPAGIIFLAVFAYQNHRLKLYV